MPKKKLGLNVDLYAYMYGLTVQFIRNLMNVSLRVAASDFMNDLRSAIIIIIFVFVVAVYYICCDLSGTLTQ